MALAFNVATFLLLVWSYSTYHGWKKISPLSVFLLFYTIYAGPQSTFIAEQSLFHNFIDDSSSEKLSYVGAISNAFVSLSPIMHKWASAKAASLRHSSSSEKVTDSRILGASIFIGIAYPLFITAIDPTNIQRIALTYQAMVGDSPFTIQQVRRELFGSSTASLIIASTRYYVAGPTIIFLLAAGLSFTRWRFMAIPLAAFLFLFGFATTHKQTWIYPIAAMLFWWIFSRQNRMGGTSPLIDRSLLALSPALGVFALTAAYCIQYFSISYPVSYWLDVAYTRIFMQSDTLAIALDHYGTRDAHLGLSGTGPLAELFGVERREPSIEVPALYNAGNPTTWQNGYLVSGWSIGGYAGVADESLMVSVIAALNSASTNIIRSNNARAVCSAACALSLWTFTQMTFSTSLFTGGTIGMIFVCGAIWLVERRTSLVEHRVAFRARRSFPDTSASAPR